MKDLTHLTLPYSNEAEQAVIDVCLTYPEKTLSKVLEGLAQADFYNSAAKTIFQILQERWQAQEPCDRMNVILAINQMPEDTRQLVSRLVIEATTAAVLQGLPGYIKVVKDCSIKRKLINQAQQMLQEGYDVSKQPDEILADAIEQLHDINKNAIRAYKEDRWHETNFHPLSISELYSQVAPGIEWLWESFLPKGGLVLLAGYMKSGKSTMAYALACAIAKGDIFLEYPTQKGGVLILAPEERLQDIRNRLQRFGANTEDPIYVKDGNPKNVQSAVRVIRAYVQQQNISLVMIDTLAKFWQITDENSNAEVMRLISPLMDLAHNENVTILLIHHERKGEGEGGRSIRGGSAILDAVDQALILKLPEGGNAPKNQRVIETIGRYDETPKKLIIELVGDEYRCLGTPDEVSLENCKEKILDTLASGGSLDMEVLVRETDIKKTTIRRALDSLVKDNIVMRTGSGKKGSPYIFTLQNAIRANSPSRWHETNFEEQLGIFDNMQNITSQERAYYETSN